MREESQLEDMRSAIRGDFERLAERRGDQELMRLSVPDADSQPELDESPDEPLPSRSWLARLLSP
ncbi:MAG: hypothetical protein ACRDPV_06055 [Gaiellaceae bacterium]